MFGVTLVQTTLWHSTSAQSRSLLSFDLHTVGIPHNLLKTFSTKLPLYLRTPLPSLSLHGRPLFLISNRTPRSENCMPVSKRRIHCPNITRRQSMSFTLLCTIQFNITLSSMFQEPNHRICFPKTSTSHSAQSKFSSPAQTPVLVSLTQRFLLPERTLKEESGVLPLKCGP